ncbi:hypothetical protein A2422_01195 [Candidatus Woesebacteria bacterium RIFOXYC1_FULL_31_51]|nr:MAG: putative Fe-S oxidoreductase [Candidatus Woesebacteria bacterium GW2011_GWF1_31_35]KKP25919.1 MAG: Radical SAM domain protein [Candidatus Woesebacteria bacterium GW2011_GWD1_31_12]KKP34609.1 MAG: Radical SAM domain protein [Candidatus Woesebacteria bacterium GW2011_GWE2_31_6]KKP74203.1 MAG: Radical SAM domain protein [Candidatus Woesebacteria bacterium GW2011_GWE1_35_20]OGM72675.1 MAG: hypothetical protein A2185_02910 [Candidatus Woesebacteria bacterium RIFOXYA1_FULL_31_71]OGM77427.1 M
MSSEYEPEIKELLFSDKYVLKSGVLLVEGYNNCALYDINSGNVYSLNNSARNILTGKTDNSFFWEKLRDMNLCTTNTDKEKSMLNELTYVPSLQFAWFEIVSKACNENCLHCYGDFMPPTYRKGLDKFHSFDNSNLKKEEKLSFVQWKSQIKNVHDLGCETCQFIGDEPFLYRGEKGESVLDLAEYAKEIGFKFIEIFTNGTLLTREMINRIKDLGVNIAISLYSIEPEIHDRITRTRGSHKKTMEALEMLKEASIPTRVETVLMKQNETSAEETQRFIDKMGFSHKRLDVLRQNGRGDNLNLLPSNDSLLKHGVMASPNFSINKDMLARNLSNNSCLSGKIAITDNGDVLPCVFSRDQIVGNVLEKSLAEIVDGNRLIKVWQNTKDCVQVCKDCEYRYCCTDCRPSSLGTNQNVGEYLTAPYPKCAYNPYEGKWGKGYWKLDLEHKPIYINILEGGEEINES